MWEGDPPGFVIVFFVLLGGPGVGIGQEGRSAAEVRRPHGEVWIDGRWAPFEPD